MPSPTSCWRRSSGRGRWTTPNASTTGAPTSKRAASSRSSVVSIQGEDEQVARVLELVELHRMEVAAAGLHREILLRTDRVGHRRTLERGADVEAPELFQRLIVVGDD